VDLLLTEPRWRSLFVDWVEIAAAATARFRAADSRLGDDPQTIARIARLQPASADFARSWSRQKVHGAAAWRKRLNHPTLGLLAFDYVALQTDGAMAGGQVVIYTRV
jgi:hypothetical protein